LGVPLSELTDSVINVADVLGSRAKHIVERLADRAPHRR
jgi:hypothetical protein